MIGCKTVLPPLGLITVAALLPDTWEIRLVDLNAETLTEDDWHWADLVMLTGMMIQRENLLDLIREAKQRQKKILVGGCYPSAQPEEVIAAGADVVVQGEAEGIMSQLQAVLEKGETGVILQLTGWPALSQSPCPRFDLLKLDYYGNMVSKPPGAVRMIVNSVMWSNFTVENHALNLRTRSWTSSRIIFG